MTDLRLALSTPADYQCPPVRLFSSAVLRAYSGMRRSQTDAWVYLPSTVFPTQDIQGMVPVIRWGNDDTPPAVQCQDRLLYLRPVFRPGRNKRTQYLHDTMIGVDPEHHGGPWLSLYLVQVFLVGDI